MSESINDKQVFSLFEVARSIQKTISERYKTSYWIKAELNKLNFYSHSGHCYPELVEKSDGKVVAQMRSILWKEDFIRINNKFSAVLNETLKDGIKVLFRASINYSVEHGITLRIIDIDPAFTLGDLEKEKQETIKRLKAENLFDRNKLRPLPKLPQRIAIISVETSKGYADFLKVLGAAHQSWNYCFFNMLFPSLLQGDKAVSAIIGQLNKIKRVINHFDVVAIVRGGGGDIGLSCYNNYELAKEIALFPIPVITGIGHATNQTVVEMISYENAITPTKLAELLIQKFHDFAVPVQRAEEKIINWSNRIIMDGKSQFAAQLKLFYSVTQQLLFRNQYTLKENVKSLITQSLFVFRSEGEQYRLVQQNLRSYCKNYYLSVAQKVTRRADELEKGVNLVLKTKRLELLSVEKNVNIMRPENVLKRGYSITYLNGKSIASVDKIEVGDEMTTVLYEGKIISTVNRKS